ncbi:MAG: Stp1/IreP family PP2C-type Ser/Thr phosphatase [Clostridia bacterium]|nr:Stp1/IreP family PP2C-type Ser/Thr phosphatase [Clostridia bacterium]
MNHRFRLNRSSRKRIESFDTVQESAAQRPASDTAAEPAAENTAPEIPEEEAPVSVRDGLAVCALTDIGMVRRSNQDSLICSGSLFGVADGMGGHLGGEIASGLARDTLIEKLADREPSEEALLSGIAAANCAVYARSEEDESVRGMGTTMTVLWFGEEDIILGHVGDSRCYRYADGKLEQVTDDHSMVMEMVRAGILTEEQAAVHPMRNVITRAVGTDPETDVDVKTLRRCPGTLWLVCSDGLHGMITDAEITEILARDTEDSDRAHQLLDAALTAGGHDNISLVLVREEEKA